MKLITLKRNDFIIRAMSPVILNLIYIIKYQTFCIVAKKVSRQCIHIYIFALFSNLKCHIKINH